VLHEVPANDAATTIKRSRTDCGTHNVLEPCIEEGADGRALSICQLRCPSCAPSHPACGALLGTMRTTSYRSTNRRPLPHLNHVGPLPFSATLEQIFGGLVRSQVQQGLGALDSRMLGYYKRLSKTTVNTCERTFACIDCKVFILPTLFQ